MIDSSENCLAVVPSSGNASSPAFSPGGNRLVYECYVPFTIETDICMRDVSAATSRC